MFKAWTDAQKCWRNGGARKASPIRVCEIDARVGGAIRIHMRAPDGSIYPMKGEIREIVPPERLAFTNIALDEAGNHIIEGFTTVTLRRRGRQNQD